VIVAEIQEGSLLEPDLELLRGCYIDMPVSGTISEASAIDLTGWVLGKSSPAVAIEIIENETVTRRLPMNHRRPDIAKAFPKVANAQNSGFRATINTLGTDEHFELGLQAVLKDQSRVPLGTIRGKRRWESGREERADHAQEHFDDQLVEETQTRIREGKWNRTSGDLLRLLFYYRTGFFSVLRGLLFGSTWKMSRTTTSYR
jgi:hypothetical protein